MSLIWEMAKSLWEVWTEMFGVLMGALPRLLSLVLWILSGIIILPCVYVAGNLYPAWTDWGGEL